jgi:hypothetical protein
MLEDDRTDGDVGEQHRAGQRQGDGGTGEAAVGADLAGHDDDVPQAAGPASFLRQGFRQVQHGARDEHDPDAGQDEEQAAPRHHVQQRAAGHRGDGRGDVAEQGDNGERASQRAVVIQVTDDSPAQHQPGRAAEALDHPHRDQRRGVGCEGADQRGRRPQEDPRQQRPAAAEAVAERAEHELPDRQADQATGDAQLRDAVARVQRAGHLRQSRKIQIQGQRSERRQASDDRQPDRPAAPALRSSAHGQRPCAGRDARPR